MDDFRIKLSWFTSRKRRRLRRRLGADGEVALLRLWAYATTSRPSGDLRGISDEDLADECGWDGEAGVLIGVLVECGLLDGQEMLHEIHDWQDHNPWVAGFERRSRSAKKAVHTREVKRGRCLGGTEFCDDRCPEDDRRDDRIDESDDRNRESDDRTVTSRSSGSDGSVIPTSTSTSDSISIPDSVSTPTSPASGESDGRLALYEVQALGYKRYHQLGGVPLAAIQRLMPIYRHELDAALATEGRSWRYAAIVIEGYREEASREAAPAGSPDAPRKEGAFARVSRKILEEWVHEPDDTDDTDE